MSISTAREVRIGEPFVRFKTRRNIGCQTVNSPLTSTSFFSRLKSTNDGCDKLSNDMDKAEAKNELKDAIMQNDTDEVHRRITRGR